VASQSGGQGGGEYMNGLSEFIFPLVASFIEPGKVGALPAAVRSDWQGVARSSQREFRLLQAPRLERRLEVDGCACGQAYFGLGAVGVAVLEPVLHMALHGMKVQLRVDVLHAMVGRLEVLENESTCQTQLLLGVGVEDTAVDEGRVVGDAILGRVSAVRVRL
jgi:hypothetical protein